MSITSPSTNSVLGSGAHVDLVDQNANATPLAQWVSGDEALYLDGLFGVTAGGADVIPTLDLEGLPCLS